jgi:hypothetical protein
MYQKLFAEFVKSGDSLQVYKDDNLVYASREKMLLPLLKYIKAYATKYQQVTIFDKIVGNAAALLLVLADCRQVYSPLASESALKTLNEHGIVYQIDQVVPYIQKPGTGKICPMEKMSWDKTPDAFYHLING